MFEKRSYFGRYNEGERIVNIAKISMELEKTTKIHGFFSKIGENKLLDVIDWIR